MSINSSKEQHQVFASSGTTDFHNDSNLGLESLTSGGATPVFCLDDSDSDDSIHQFLVGGTGSQQVSPGSLNNYQDDDEEDERMLLDTGSPYGAARTRPPSPRRPIASAAGSSVAFRASASQPTPSSPLAASAALHSQRRQQQQQPLRHSKKRLTEENEDPYADDYECQPFGRRLLQLPSSANSAPFAASAKFKEDESKRPRLTVVTPLGDASNLPPPPPPPPVALLGRCLSEHCGRSGGAMDTARIDKAIASIDSLNLIGNSTQRHSLPTVKELDFGIRSVTPATVSRLLAGQFADRVGRYLIVDCRYPYEYQGGHIRGAVNLYRPDELINRLLAGDENGGSGGGAIDPVAIIFHCEFSSHRAPRMARLLRQRDREVNSHSYPQLHYPELYLLRGGYRAFYEAHKSDCEPRNYTKMADPAHADQLTYFDRQERAWERQNSRTKHSRLQRLAGSPLLK